MSKSNLMTEEPQTRQDQVLQAAARCFVQEGFHGASMARIAKAAGMSPGHIYHYFASKEEIITEIVKREEMDSRAFFDQFRQCTPDNFIDTLISQVADGVRNAADPFHSMLMLEILAETTRNEKVARIARKVDRDVRLNFAEIIKEKLGVDDIEERVETLFALFGGLGIRINRNPELDHDKIAMHFSKAITHILTASFEK